jgi:hypothetical protein
VGRKDAQSRSSCAANSGIGGLHRRQMLASHAIWRTAHVMEERGCKCIARDGRIDTDTGSGPQLGSTAIVFARVHVYRSSILHLYPHLVPRTHMRNSKIEIQTNSLLEQRPKGGCHSKTTWNPFTRTYPYGEDSGGYPDTPTGLPQR